MAITADNVILAKLMRRYGNVPQHISATPLSRVVEKAVPYLRQEAGRNAALAARSHNTGREAEQGRETLALKQTELDHYTDQAEKATYVALADLFGVTPLSIYKGFQDDQKAEARRKETAARQAEQDALIRQSIADNKAYHDAARRRWDEQIADARWRAADPTRRSFWE